MKKFHCKCCKKKLGKWAIIGPNQTFYCFFCWRIRKNIGKILIAKALAITGISGVYYRSDVIQQFHKYWDEWIKYFD